eukprot:TRINITY_DN16182_c0_g1_i1.p3 TRINITY_DN16182_c0_g1~~TRINITY_DN16182_c0_g1_i1.p3  ORF type:complete len:112 (-),score=12.25 TRINITY_DN16182_c0_g1_i1:29-364(-)
MRETMERPGELEKVQTGVCVRGFQAGGGRRHNDGLQLRAGSELLQGDQGAGVQLHDFPPCLQPDHTDLAVPQVTGDALGGWLIELVHLRVPQAVVQIEHNHRRDCLRDCHR